MLTVRDFVFQVYRLISAQNPTTPLHGDDQKLAIKVLNQLLNAYSSTGLMTTIAKTYTIPLPAGTSNLVAGPADYLPTPDLPYGRLANLLDAWLTLEGVTYPLIIESRDDFLSAWKYDPLRSLPRFIIVFPDTEIVNLRLYPAPDQAYEFNIRAKWQLADLTSNDDMSSLPTYFYRFLLFATARDVCLYTGRAEAWTEMLEKTYQEAWANMESASELNLSITGDRGNLLNGAALVIAGTR